MSAVLFICTGNICRSPMAVGLLRRKLAAEVPHAGHRVWSAGTWALDGQAASEHALAVMAERGIDISEHVAHSVNAADVAEADLVLTMSQEQAEFVRRMWPQYRWKVHRLAEMSGKKKDVRDPYGESVEAYRESAGIISDYIDRGIKRILELL